MEGSRVDWIGRRVALQLIGAGGGAALGLPRGALAQSRKDVLVIGIDFSDVITLDPARSAQYTPPMMIQAAYDTLVTMAAGDYLTVKPALATRWERMPDGKGWRFTLRDGVRFASGNALTAADVKWSLDRLINLRDQPGQYVQCIDRVDIVDAGTVDITLNQPTEPLLTILTAPGCVILDRQLVEAHGGVAGADARDADKATAWLDEHSAGSGAYALTRWERNAQIQFRRNPNYWRGKVAFERIVIRHISDGSGQLLALRHGDIDVAFNLIPEQVATLKDAADIRVESLDSLDFFYLALTQSADYNAALAIPQARQAIGYSLDYDGIRDSLLGGAARRPASFLPVGVRGSTEEIATKIGFHEDLAKARDLLAQAGLPQGFAFELVYGTSAVAGITYQTLAQKMQADLSRVGIRAKLAPMDSVSMRTVYASGKFTGGVLAPWPPAAVENQLWAGASVERVAKRLHWTPPESLVRLVNDAATATDTEKQTRLWVEYQRVMVEQANLIVLFQPIYRIGVRKTIAPLPLTGAGWLLDLYAAKPA